MTYIFRDTLIYFQGHLTKLLKVYALFYEKDGFAIEKKPGSFFEFLRG